MRDRQRLERKAVLGLKDVSVVLDGVSGFWAMMGWMTGMGRRRLTLV
jgi:hypothetical protein